MQREVSFLYGGFFDIGKSVSGQSAGRVRARRKKTDVSI